MPDMVFISNSSIFKFPWLFVGDVDVLSLYDPARD